MLEVVGLPRLHLVVVQLRLEAGRQDADAMCTAVRETRRMGRARMYACVTWLRGRGRVRVGEAKYTLKTHTEERRVWRGEIVRDRRRGKAGGGNEG